VGGEIAPSGSGSAPPYAAVSPRPIDLARYFIALGSFGFGGPVALAEAMHRDLVERRGWMTEAEYCRGITLAQLCPGPLAGQLCFYVGYLRGGPLGAVCAGLAFILPSFVMVVGLGWAYRRFGGLAWMRAAFYGVGAAVVALIGQSAARLGRKTVGRDPLLIVAALTLGLATAVTGRESVVMVILAGVVVAFLRSLPRSWAGPGVAREVGSVLLLLKLASLFAYAGALVFGSGLAVIPFLHGRLVEGTHWLTESQFLDAVAVAMITPGPVVIVAGFIGFLVADLAGATVAVAATFLPAFGLTLALAPYLDRIARRSGLVAFVAGVTAAATGALAGAATLFARQALRDAPTVVIALLALGVTLLPRRVPDIVLVAAAGAVGVVLRS
jgi:chromate transporter